MTSNFSTNALIWVHFKTMHWFSQQMFSLFSHLNSAQHNLVIELCSAPNNQKKLWLFSKVARIFIAIELLIFSKMKISIFFEQ